MTVLVETSALVGVILEEADRAELIARIQSADDPFISVINMVEAALGVGKVIGDYDIAKGIVEKFVEHLRIRVVAVEAGIFPDVMAAVVRYGKGNGHPARLNFGDCFSYALAHRAGGKIIFKGRDFLHTDLVAA